MSKAVLPKGESEEGANEWADVFANDKALREAVNSIDNEQVASDAAISGSKLADKSIPGAKLERQPLLGVVSSAGEKIRGSEGWAVEKLATGRYKLSFSPELSSDAVANATLDQTSGLVFVRIQGQNKKEVEIRFFNSSLDAEDAQFSFHVLY